MAAVPPPATTSLGAVLAPATISAVLPLTTGQGAVLLPLGRVPYCHHLSGCSTATYQIGVQLVLETFSFSDCTLQDFLIFKFLILSILWYFLFAVQPEGSYVCVCVLLKLSGLLVGEACD